MSDGGLEESLLGQALAVEGGEAIAQPHRVVRASAGSGKTHRLALRYLEILFAGGRPDSIVAVTFTREAAGEILGRVLTRLAAGAADGAEARRLGSRIGRPELTRRQAERALRGVCSTLDRLVIATLDSFFFRLTAALRLELGLAGVPAVASLDDPLLAALREQALEATLTELADRDWQELVDLFERLHGTGARRSVARALDQVLLELYEIYLEAPSAELWGRLDLAPGPDATAVQAAIAALEASLRASAPGALRKALAADLEAARRAEWDRLVDRGLVGKIVVDGAAARYGSSAIPAAWLPSLLVLAAHARERLLLSATGRTRATHELLDAFHRHYRRLRRRRGVLLFSDLASGLERWLDAAPAEALGELYYRIDERVGHLLLDEFQDTSLAQWSVLRPIAEEIRAWGDGSRTFFCVGDPKQAIYGWRGGCADLFDQIEEDLALDPGSGLRLDESFRSSQVVLDAVNAVFGGLRSVPALAEHGETVERWSAAFGAHRSRTDSPGYVELVESPRGEDHVDWSARGIAELARAVPAATIAVLVQTNDQAVAMLDALRRRGVDASGEGAGAVADDPAVAAVIAALVLADHPGDTVAAFHVAGSPLGRVVGLGMGSPAPPSSGSSEHADLAGPPAIPRLASPEPAAVLVVARRLRVELVERGAAAVVSDWKRALRDATGERSRRRLEQAVDLAERFEREGGGRPGDLAEYLSRSTVESARHAGVRVMTVHRAKGLEFDLVVLPALDRALLRGADTPVYLLRRSPLAPVEAVHRSAPAGVRRLSRELERGSELERARRLRDDLSALYVALTRARLAVHLWVEPATSGGGGAGGGTLSFAAILRHTLAAESSEPLYRAGDLEAVKRLLGAPRGPARAERQSRLPLAPGRGRSGVAALRPAVGLDELEGAAEHSARTLLAAATLDHQEVRTAWREIDAAIAGEERAPSIPELAGARSWLLAGGRRIARRERERRFAEVLGGVTVAGEIARLWIASAPGVAPRALIGADSRAGAEVVRRIAARWIEHGEPGGPGLAHEIAVLLGGGAWTLHLPPDR